MVPGRGFDSLGTE